MACLAQCSGMSLDVGPPSSARDRVLGLSFDPDEEIGVSQVLRQRFEAGREAQLKSSKHVVVADVGEASRALRRVLGYEPVVGPDLERYSEICESLAADAVHSVRPEVVGR